MPRYFFHIHDSKAIRDDEGSVFPNDEAAENTAVVLAGENAERPQGRFLERKQLALGSA